MSYRPEERDREALEELKLRERVEHLQRMVDRLVVGFEALVKAVSAIAAHQNVPVVETLNPKVVD
jgi:hypothetical protein